MTFLMRKVVEYGTGKRVRELGRPAAGKTGTSDDFNDAWFMGYTADLVVGVWVGRQTPMTIAEEATGGVVALPIWLGFMKAAHPDTPPREFPVPADTVLVPVGDDLLPFTRGRVPSKYLGGRAEPSP
jgi:penicillin-binding protein 1A